MKNINKIRLLLLLSAAVVIAVSCAGGMNRNKDDNLNKRQVMSGQNDVEKDPDATSPLTATYVMRLEDTTLTLYEVADGEEIALTTVTIDPSYYPSEDIKELNQGMVAYSKEEGFARMENYTN